MMLDNTTRKRVRLSAETGVLQSVVNNGEETALEIARCQIDGMMNGLIRLEGVPKAAEFAFALSDRVAAGLLLKPTDFRERNDKVPDADKQTDQVKRPACSRLWPTFLFGAVYGAAVTMYIAWLFWRYG